MVNVGVEHGSTARGTVYERAVDLARMGDTWLANGLKLGWQRARACGARMLDFITDYAPGADGV